MLQPILALITALSMLVIGIAALCLQSPELGIAINAGLFFAVAALDS